VLKMEKVKKGEAASMIGRSVEVQERLAIGE
jgi:hypothetical protein